MGRIDCEVFKPKGTGSAVFVQALEDLNRWKAENPSARVLNVETIMGTTGGGINGADVRIASIGLRVWFEAS